MATKLLRLPDVLALTGLKKTSVYQRINQGTFPSPVRLGARAIAFREEEISEWIDALPRTSSPPIPKEA